LRIKGFQSLADAMNEHQRLVCVCKISNFAIGK